MIGIVNTIIAAIEPALREAEMQECTPLRVWNRPELTAIHDLLFAANGAGRETLLSNYYAKDIDARIEEAYRRGLERGKTA